MGHEECLGLQQGAGGKISRSKGVRDGAVLSSSELEKRVLGTRDGERKVRACM